MGENQEIWASWPFALLLILYDRLIDPTVMLRAGNAHQAASHGRGAEGGDLFEGMRRL